MRPRPSIPEAERHWALKASDIAELVGGTFEGAMDPELWGVGPIDRAGTTQLSFVADAKYLPYLEGAQAGAVLIAESLAMRGSSKLPRIVVPDVHRALALLLRHLHPEKTPRPGVHPTAVLGHGVVLGEGVSVGPYAVLGDQVEVDSGAVIGAHCVVGDNCRLGAQVTLHPAVTLYPRVQIGERSIVHSGARLGSDGFGYALVDGRQEKVPQVGGCVLGADVEIGANTTIDRGSIGNTEIGEGVKIDNLVHIGHNCRIGAHSVIVAQVGISGSVVVGSRVTLAGQVGVVGHLRIADQVVIGGKSVVWANIDQPGLYSGNPARPHKEALRAQAAVGKLPELLKRLKRLEQTVLGRKDTAE